MQIHFHEYIWRFGPQLSEMIPHIHLWTNILCFSPKWQRGSKMTPNKRIFWRESCYLGIPVYLLMGSHQKEVKGQVCGRTHWLILYFIRIGRTSPRHCWSCERQQMNKDANGVKKQLIVSFPSTERTEFSISLSPPAPHRKLASYTIGMQPCPFSPTLWARHGWLAQSAGGQLLGDPCFGSSFCWASTFCPKYMTHFMVQQDQMSPACPFSLPSDSREYQPTQNLKGKRKNNLL